MSVLRIIGIIILFLAFLALFLTKPIAKKVLPSLTDEELLEILYRSKLIVFAVCIVGAALILFF